MGKTQGREDKAGTVRNVKPYAQWNESTKEAQRAYKKRSRKKITVDLPIETAARFREYCTANGQTVSGMLSRFVYETLAQANSPTDPD